MKGGLIFFAFGISLRFIHALYTAVTTNIMLLSFMKMYK